jgi:putative transposase
MAIDLNFDNITLATFTFNGRLLKLKRFKTPLRKVLTHRIWIERVQRRYSKSWRFTKGVRRAIKKHGKRMRNISWDYAHKVGDLVAGLALEHRSVVVLEDLEKLRDSEKGSRKFNKELALWSYRRIQFCIEYEARERGLEVVKVSPRGTSSKCPKCGGKLAENGRRVLECKRCGFVGDRDVIATINLYKKHVSKSKCSRCGVPRVALNAPEPDEDTSGVRGNRDEAMTSSYMNLCES